MNNGEALNQLLVDTRMLRDLYKKHHWQAAGPTFYQLHLLFDNHYEQQNEIVDLLGERIQLLGGGSTAMAHEVAELTRVPPPPRGTEDSPAQLARLLHAHEIVLSEARAVARAMAERGEQGTNDLIVSNVIRTNELQAWFVAQHLVELPNVQAGMERTDDGSGHSRKNAPFHYHE
jgi:starvation-inducible DNA-binding protein